MSEKLAAHLASKTKPLTDAEASDLLARRFPEGARENASSDVTALDQVGMEGLPQPEGFIVMQAKGDLEDMHKRMHAALVAHGRPDEFMVLNCIPCRPKNDDGAATPASK